MNVRVWVAGLVVVVVTTACGDGNQARSSSTEAREVTDPWSFTLELAVSEHAAAGREDVEMTVEIVTGIGEAPAVAHRAPLRAGSSKIDLDLTDAVGIDIRLDDTLALAIDRPFWNRIYDGRIRVRIRRGGFTLVRRIPVAGCWGDRSACRQTSDRIHLPMPAEDMDGTGNVPVLIRTTRRLTEQIGAAELTVRIIPDEGGEEDVVLQQLVDEPLHVDETFELEGEASLRVSVGKTHSIVISPEVWKTAWDRVTVTIDDDDIRVVSRVLVGQRLQRRDERFPVSPPHGSGI